VRKREKEKVRERERWIVFSLCRSTWTNTVTLLHCYWTELALIKNTHTQRWLCVCADTADKPTIPKRAHTHTHTHIDNTHAQSHTLTAATQTKFWRKAWKNQSRTADVPVETQSSVLLYCVYEVSDSNHAYYTQKSQEISKNSEQQPDRLVLHHSIIERGW